ncbi:MAG: DUF1579 domain-containing protein [Calditrichaeota bacterium]|nr:MAG: DUF1579 domain-containing protein [Calditrichota bacterium]
MFLSKMLSYFLYNKFARSARRAHCKQIGEDKIKTIRPITPLLIIFSIFWVTTALAQEGTRQRPCDLPEGKQFDFWLGKWDLSWPAEQFGGPPGSRQHGTNTVTKILDDCVVYESFRFPDGNFYGHSFSVYDARSRQWKQTWVDNKGGYLLFTGQLKEGQMILSTAPYQRDGKTYVSRMVFENISAEALDWRYERSEDRGKSWTPIWTIHYTRKPPPEQ